MRVLFVSAYGLPHTGGIEVAVDSLATELSGRGHSVRHLASSTGSAASDPGRNYIRIRVAAINPLETRFGVPYPLFGPTLLTHLRREIARADVVHAHGYIYPGSVTAAALARRTRPPTPMVLTEHVGHVPYDSPLIDRIETMAIGGLGRGTLRRSDAVVTYNDRVAEQLVELCPSIEPETILNGVDSELFRPADEAERSRLRSELGWDDRPRLLFVGRPVAKKGFSEAVRAVEEAGVPGVRLVVVGSDVQPDAASRRVTSLGLLPRERLAEVYRACDAMIIPARGEGFPLSAQEALSSGLPLLLAADPGYAPNLSGAGEGARTVEDPAEFPTALAELLGDRATLAEAGRAAAAHARRAFSWARCAERHEALYERLLGSAPAQPS